MKLIIIDRKAWERHRSEFADFIHRVEKLIGNPPKTEQWLDNEAVCKRLGISKRTLQSYRDTGKIPFSMIGHKCYYKQTDICEMLNAVKDWNQRMNGEEVCSQLRPSTRTLQEYRNSGTLPFYKIGGKILYKQSDIQAMLEKHYNPIPKKLWQE